MSTPAAVVFPKTLKLDSEKMHRLRLRLGYVLAVVLILGLAVYGFGYYFWTPPSGRFPSNITC